MIADVPNWIFERHCLELQKRLADEFDITVAYPNQWFDEDEYDLVYPLEWNLMGPSLIRRPEKWVTGVRSHTSWAPYGAETLANHLRVNFQRTHTVSRRLVEELAPFLPGIEYVTHGVDTEHFAPRTRADLSGAGALRLAWAGNRRAPAKRFDELIRPLGELPGVELTICGYSDQNLDISGMRDFYDGVDAYVCASDLEGNNNSVLEAASMARCVITRDTGTVPEFLESGESARIVGDRLEDLVEAVTWLRDHPEERQRMGERAREAVLGAFDWRDRAEDYRRFLRESLKAIGFGVQAPAAASASAAAGGGVRELLTEALTHLREGQSGEARECLEQGAIAYPEFPQFRSALSDLQAMFKENATPPAASAAVGIHVVEAQPATPEPPPAWTPPETRALPEAWARHADLLRESVLEISVGSPTLEPGAPVDCEYTAYDPWDSRICFPSRSFECVYTSGALARAEDPWELFGELARIARSTLIVELANPWADFFSMLCHGALAAEAPLARYGLPAEPRRGNEAPDRWFFSLGEAASFLVRSARAHGFEVASLDLAGPGNPQQWQQRYEELRDAGLFAGDSDGRSLFARSLCAVLRRSA